MANRPLGVTVLAILHWLAMLLFIWAFFVWDDLVRELRDNGELTQKEADDAINMGWIILIPAILLFLIGLGLWKLINIVRIVVIILQVLGAIGAVLTLGIIQLLIHVLIIWYLWKESTRRAFTS